MHSFDPQKIKQDFPIFQNNASLVYLDNAATTHVPQIVLDAMHNYYTNYNANIHRGLYDLSEKASTAYEQARETIASVLETNTDQIICTAGTTIALNMLAHMLHNQIRQGENIVLTELDHHANMLPWMRLAHEKKALIHTISIDKETATLSEDAITRCITDKTRIVAVTYRSNVIGAKTPLKKIIDLAHSAQAYVVVDAAQAQWYELKEIVTLGADCIVFSGHKLYGPKGVGILYATRDILTMCEPGFLGGGMVHKISNDFTKNTYADIPTRFEAGTPPIAEFIGLAAACTYFDTHIDVVSYQKHLTTVREMLISGLKEIEGIRIYGTDQDAGIVSFTLAGIHAHDLGQILADHTIAVRVGHHCATLLLNALDTPALIRISLGVYNTKQDIEKLLDAIAHAKKIFHV